MESRIFDRETLLDLTVNVIPLAIIAFFIVGFAIFNPFGYDPLASGIQFGLLVAPFAALAVLTYLSGKAIASAERSGAVYIPGQATVEGEQPIEVHGAGPGAEGELVGVEEGDAPAAEATAERATEEPADERGEASEGQTAEERTA
jgi:hypothetical protein